MTQHELQQGLDALYRDLARAEAWDEETACRVFNTDSRAEIIEVIREEIALYEQLLDRPDEDTGMDYDALCSVLGLSRYA